LVVANDVPFEAGCRTTEEDGVLAQGLLHSVENLLLDTDAGRQQNDGRALIHRVASVFDGTADGSTGEFLRCVRSGLRRHTELDVGAGDGHDSDGVAVGGHLALAKAALAEAAVGQNAARVRSGAVDARVCS
jgi:hypothetical protein